MGGCRVVRFPVLPAVFVALFLWSETARAELITYELAGTISDTRTVFAIGDPWVGSFTYDSAAPETDPNYAWSGDTSSMSITANGVTWTAPRMDYLVLFSDGTFEADARGVVGPWVQGFSFYEFYFTLPRVTSGSAGGVVTLPPLLPWSEGSTGRFMLYDCVDSGGSIVFEIESMTPVPEPTSLLLLGTGLVTAALVRRRRR